MPKRKREEHVHDGGEDTQSKRSVAHGKRVEEKLHHHKILLFRALKIAKGFERQKLGRRRKTAVNDNGADVGRIDAEIDALKALDLSTTAEDYLCKIIQKDKQLSDKEELQGYVRAHTRTTPAQAAAVNVIARLYNSNPIKEAAKGVLTALRSALGIRHEISSSTKGGRPAAVGGEDQAGPSGPGESSEKLLRQGKGFPEVINHKETEDGNVMLEDSVYDSSSDHEGEHDQRLASPSDDDSVDIEALRASVHDGARSEISLLASEDESSADETEDTTGKVQSNGVNGQRDLPATTSTTFLPSLNMGGYWSGSESEAEDDIPEIAPKKNRRGQRARREIWEQKFGQKAKHLQSTKAQGGRREDDWDPRRGAKTIGDPEQRRGRSAHASGVRFASGGNAITVVPRRGRSDAPSAKTKSKTTEKLHPSWEAAKKVKSERQTAAFAGSRVTFA